MAPLLAVKSQPRACIYRVWGGCASYTHQNCRYGPTSSSSREKHTMMVTINLEIACIAKTKYVYVYRTDQDQSVSWETIFVYGDRSWRKLCLVFLLVRIFFSIGFAPNSIRGQTLETMSSFAVSSFHQRLTAWATHIKWLVPFVQDTPIKSSNETTLFMPLLTVVIMLYPHLTGAVRYLTPMCHCLVTVIYEHNYNNS